MEGYKNLKNDMMQFEATIRNLSAGINNSGMNWRDPQFSQLSGKIAKIASSSKGVIMAGQKCESAINRFESIVSEV